MGRDRCNFYLNPITERNGYCIDKLLASKYVYTNFLGTN